MDRLAEPHAEAWYRSQIHVRDLELAEVRALLLATITERDHYKAALLQIGRTGAGALNG